MDPHYLNNSNFFFPKLELPNKSTLSQAPPIMTCHILFKEWNKMVWNPTLETYSHIFHWPILKYKIFKWKKYLFSFTPVIFNRILYKMHQAYYFLCFPHRTHISVKTFSWPGFLFISAYGFLQCPSPHPNSSSTSLPPSFWPCLLFFPPIPAHPHQCRHPVRLRDWMENMTGSFPDFR